MGTACVLAIMIDVIITLLDPNYGQIELFAYS